MSKTLLNPDLDPTRLPRIRIVGPISDEPEGKPLYVADVVAAFDPDQDKVVESAASIRVVAAHLHSKFDSPDVLRAEMAPVGIAMRDPETPEETPPGNWSQMLVSGVYDTWPWPPIPQPHDNPVVPALRLDKGRIPMLIRVGSHTADFLRLDDNFILGCLPCTTQRGTFPITLTPAGIEFEAAVPLPSIEFTGAAESVPATLRLTWRKKDTYWLQLVGGTVENLAKIKTALAGICLDLQKKGSPARLDYDFTLDVPPLSWPIERSGSLKLKNAEYDRPHRRWKSWQAHLDPSATRCRMRTSTFGWTADKEVLAEFTPDLVEITKSFQNKTLQITVAGGDGRSSLEKINTWSRVASKWENEFDPGLKFANAYVDTKELRGRLQRSYFEARAIDAPDADPLYTFIPIRRGWLQVALTALSSTGGAGPVPTRPKQILTGEIHLPEPVMPGPAPRPKPRRGIQLEGTDRLELQIAWGNTGLKQCSLSAANVRGRLSGFLFCVDRSPTAQEALPTLQAGPVSTHELSVLFGYPKSEDSWGVPDVSLGGQVFKLQLKRPPDAPQKLPDYLWLPDPERPAIPTMPITRASASNEYPSSSRHLLPRILDRHIQTLDLRMVQAEALPFIDNLPNLTWPEELNWPQSDRRLRLTLPTLPGVEFVPKAPPSAVLVGTLRADLPILDELFANTELPQEKIAPPPPAGPGGPRPDEVVKPASATAITFARLAREVWTVAQDKLDLAAVDSTDLAGPAETGGPAVPGPVETLIQPYALPLPFQVKTAANGLPAGSYKFDGQTYFGEGAAEGMRLTSLNLPGVVEAVAVNHLAAKLFPNSGLRQDSRGFAVDPLAAIKTKYIARTTNLVASATRKIQITLREPSLHHGVSFWFANVSFPGASGVLHFDGSTNPVESLTGESGGGELLGPLKIADAMHEWRLFRDGLRSHLIPVGKSFLFQPLRLLEFDFDTATGDVSGLRVLGRLTLSKPQSNEQAQPFHSDDPHAFGNLVEWNLETNTLSPHLSGITAIPLVFDVDLNNDSDRAHIERVPIRLEYTMTAGQAPEDNAGTWTARFNIAGTQCQRTGGVLAPDGEAFEIVFDSAVGNHKFAFSKLSLRFEDARTKLILEPQLKLSAGKLPRAATALCWKPSGLDWFGVKAQLQDAWTFRFSTGRLTIPIRSTTESVKGELIPGISGNKLLLEGHIECVVQPRVDHFEVLALYAEILGTFASGRAPSLSYIAKVGAVDGFTQTLSLTGALLRTSWIEWPGNATITPQGKSTLVEIPQSGATYKHDFRVNFDGHKFPIEKLVEGGTTLTLKGDWRFEARVDHTLFPEPADDGAPTRKWASLDQLRILSQADWVKEAKYRKKEVAGFAPLPRFGKYRGEEIVGRMKTAGIADADLAASGLRDKNLADEVAKGATDQYDLYLFGASLVLFPGDAAQYRPLMWRYFSSVAMTEPPNPPIPHLLQRDPNHKLSWRMSNYDDGSRLLLHIEPRDAETRSLGGITSEAVIRQEAGLPGAEYDWVEQEFFELVPPAHPRQAQVRTDPRQQMAQRRVQRGRVRPADDQLKMEVFSAPFFITTLLALRHLLTTKGIIGLQCETIRLPNTVPGLTRRVSVAADLGVVARSKEYELIVLSGSELEDTPLRTKNSIAPGTVKVAASATEAAARAGNTSVARSLVLNPVAAVLRSVDTNGAASIRAVPLLPPVVDSPSPLERTEEDLVPPSPVLGWPSKEGITAAVLQFANLGDDDVLANHEAGLTGRGIVTGWPAVAPSADAVPGFFYNCNAVVQFRRTPGDKFFGPTPRHLLPVPARVRVPTRDATSAALKTVIEKGGVTAPISVPRLEKSIFGLRPGAFHVMTTSVTVPADDKPFDQQQERFGSAGTRGTVLLHQLRAPRGTPLPRTNDLDYRRRTFLSPADLTTGSDLALFKVMDGSAAVFRKFRGADAWRFIVRPLAGASSLSAEWNGTLSLEIHCATTSTAPLPPMLAELGILPRTPRDPMTPVPPVTSPEDCPQIDLIVGSQSFPFDSLQWAENTGVVSLSLMLSATRQSAQLALLHATSNTNIAVQIRFFEGSAPRQPLPAAQDLPLTRITGEQSFISGPPDVIRVPLWIAPGQRRSLPVQSTTIAFGDPSYDRQLASPTLSDSRATPDGNLVLALDRAEYDVSSTIFFAFGLAPTPGAEFSTINPLRFQLTFDWISYRFPADAGDESAVSLLPSSTGPNSGIQSAEAYSIPLSAFTYKAKIGPKETADKPVPWSHGDKLVVTVASGTGPNPLSLKVTARVVAVPQIAPPPSVFSVVRKGTGQGGVVFLDVPLHASGPMPQRIEFVDLLRDLAIGHVRRRALFVWSWSEPAQPMQITLVKIDRTGGTQIPIDPGDFQIP